jgi:two-component system, OmpR family, phosphate regulon sensor histidine kinase PhoR
MTNRRIQSIVGLMAVGLLGLIGFQWFWISNALQLQEEQFAYKATDALQSVVRTLERQEIRFLIRQREQASDQQRRILAMGQPANLPANVLNNRSLMKQTATANRLSANEIRRPRLSAAVSRPAKKPQLVKRLDNELAAQAEPAGQLTIERLGFPGQSVAPTDVLHPTTVSLSAEQVLIVEQYLQQQELLMANGDFMAQLAQQQQFDAWVDHDLLGQLHRLNKSGRRGNRGDTLTMPTNHPRRTRLLRERLARSTAPLLPRPAGSVPTPPTAKPTHSRP